MSDDHDHEYRDVIHYTYDFGRLSEFGLKILKILMMPYRFLLVPTL